jgi:hypothetical protein
MIFLNDQFVKITDTNGMPKFICWLVGYNLSFMAKKRSHIRTQQCRITLKPNFGENRKKISFGFFYEKK